MLVRNAIFNLVFLNRFVIKFVSFPMSVNVTHLCVGVSVVVAIFLCSSLVGGFGVGGLCGSIGKALLYIMFWIMFSSVLYSSSCKLCVQSVVEKSYGSVFVLGWVVGGVWDDSVCESGFPL